MSRKSQMIQLPSIKISEFQISKNRNSGPGTEHSSLQSKMKKKQQNLNNKANFLSIYFSVF